jgi:hypothetical protein
MKSIKLLILWIKRILKRLHEQAWTIAGTILVLITLSGDIQKWGITVSVVTFLITMSFMYDRDDPNESDE